MLRDWLTDPRCLLGAIFIVGAFLLGFVMVLA